MKQLIKLLEEEKRKRGPEKKGPLVVSIVGAGGKSTLLYGLGRRLREENYRSVGTTSTMVFYPEDELLDNVLIGASEAELKVEIEQYQKPFYFFFGDHCEAIEEEGKVLKKVKGHSSLELNRMIAEDLFQGIDFLLIEADGARQLPLKAPGENEPCIPERTDVVIGIMGMDALGKELKDGNVHRAEQMARLLEQPLGSVISETTFRKLAMSQDGLFRNSPLGARRIMILNKAEGVEKQLIAENIVKGILEQHDGINDFLIASLEQQYIYKRLPLKLSLIVFGAGKSTRMGEQKLLMELDGARILEKVLGTVTRRAYLDPERLGQIVKSETLLVYHEEAVKVIGEQFGIEKLIWNPEPERGMSSSLLLAAENMSRDSDGYVFFMGDQPFLDENTLTNILKLWLKDTTRIVVPYFAGKQGNPVLFPWELRERLLWVTGDKGGRDVIKSSLDKVVFCEIEESTPGVDIDDYECYTRYKDGNQ